MEGDEKTGVRIVAKALEAPIRQIAANAGLDGSVILEKVRTSGKTGYGFDAYKEEYCDMVSAGIIDPAKVTRSALENAVSYTHLDSHLLTACRETFSWAAKSSWVMPRARRSSCNRSPNAIRLSSLSVILAEPPRRFHQLCFASGKIPCNFRFPSGKCGSGGVYRYCIMPILQIPFHFGYKTSRPAGGSCGKSRRASRHFPQSAL